LASPKAARLSAARAYQRLLLDRLGEGGFGPLRLPAGRGDYAGIVEPGGEGLIAFAGQTLRQFRHGRGALAQIIGEARQARVDRRCTLKGRQRFGPAAAQHQRPAKVVSYLGPAGSSSAARA
jgi:hypothetical protein